jgi:GNAT superfamily N-acetyltransferase
MIFDPTQALTRANPSRTLARPAGKRRTPAIPPTSGAVTVRPVRRGDLDQVTALDAAVTGVEKRDYWERIHRRYGTAAKGEHRWFLVAMTGAQVVGFVIGEVRDWEFGSPPCGWVFAMTVDPKARQAGIATRLLAAISDALRAIGVNKLRTLLSADNTLILSFFRSQGMMAAPMIPLEMDVAPDDGARGGKA